MPKPTLTRWTSDEITMLMEAVESSRTASEAFKQVAKKTKRKPATVAQKYYAMVRSGSKAQRAPRVTRSAATPRTPRTATTPSFDGLSNAQLANLVSDATAELAGRINRIEDNVRSLLQ